MSIQWTGWLEAVFVLVTGFYFKLLNKPRCSQICSDVAVYLPASQSANSQIFTNDEKWMKRG